MSRERGIYDGSLTPHPWDNWRHEYLKMQSQRLTATTGQGETLRIELLKSSGRDWADSRELTSSCGACPLYVSGEEVKKAAEYLQKSAHRHIRMPNKPAGMCLFPYSSSEASQYHTVHKFLVSNNDSMLSCNISEPRRLKRAENMRAKKELIGKDIPEE